MNGITAKSQTFKFSNRLPGHNLQFIRQNLAYQVCKPITIKVFSVGKGFISFSNELD